MKDELIEIENSYNKLNEKDVMSFANAISGFLYNECHWRKHCSEKTAKKPKKK